MLAEIHKTERSLSGGRGKHLHRRKQQALVRAEHQSRLGPRIDYALCGQEAASSRNNVQLTLQGVSVRELKNNRSSFSKVEAGCPPVLIRIGSHTALAKYDTCL